MTTPSSVSEQSPQASTASDPHSGDPGEPASAVSTWRLPWWGAVGAAALAGVALVSAFPRIDLWWTAPAGVALFAVATHRRGAWHAAMLGLVTGLVFFIPLLHWTAIDARIGYWPWLLLAASQACFVAVLGVAGAWCSRLADRWLWCWPVVIGVLWTADEALRSRLPFGGFPWGRLAFSQADSPLAWWAALGGAPLVTFVTAAAGGLLATAVWLLLDSSRPATPSGWRRRGGRVAAAAAAAALAVISGWATPYAPPSGDRVTVAIVQGNVPRIGLDFNAQRRAVLDNHVDATLKLASRVRQGKATRPDLVVWPENASDIDPLVNSDAHARISEAAWAIDAPILVGTILSGPGSRHRNAGLVWLPGRGPVDRYVKQHPVPFAEYLPMRPFVKVITDKADLAGNFAAGHEPGVLRVGPAVVGDVICFEVAYDNLVRDTVVGGAQLIVVQTNNATFNAAEARQQMAMVRLRAIEHGRPALMASTVGVSGFVDADGTVSQASGFNTADVSVRTVRLGEGRTLATRLGALPEALAGLAAAGALVAAFASRGRSRRQAESGAPSIAQGSRCAEKGEGT